MEIIYIFLVDFDRDTREFCLDDEGSSRFVVIFTAVYRLRYTVGKRRRVYKRSRKARCVYIRKVRTRATRCLYRVYIYIRSILFGCSPSNGRATRVASFV